MKSKVKIAVIGALFLFTVFFSAFSIVSYVSAEDGGETESCLAESGENCYVLRNYEGYVAVYVENDPSCPITVTDIQVSTLRELDRMLLETGLKFDSRERLLMTLEDLGS